jgi:hypothetical protein
LIRFIDVSDLVHQAARLGSVAGLGVEIGPDAVPQVDGLADVDDLAVGVFHQVAARLAGQGTQDALQVIGDFH